LDGTIKKSTEPYKVHNIRLWYIKTDNFNFSSELPSFVGEKSSKLKSLAWAPLSPDQCALLFVDKRLPQLY
jgi:hypothetical protein